MPLREDLLNPIPGDNPAGTNLYYDPVYPKIKEARREDDDAPQGEWAVARKVADYVQVIRKYACYCFYCGMPRYKKGISVV
jgi:type VI secretion system protein ImpA